MNWNENGISIDAIIQDDHFIVSRKSLEPSRGRVGLFCSHSARESVYVLLQESTRLRANKSEIKLTQAAVDDKSWHTCNKIGN